MAYEPSGSVEWLHGLARKTLSLGPATNEFPSNGFDSSSWGDESTESGEYLQGVAYSTLVLLIVGGIVFMALTGAYAGSLCCSKCCCKRWRDPSSKDGSVHSANKIFKLIFIACAGAAALFSFLTSTGVAGVLTSIENGNEVGLDLVDTLDDMTLRSTNIENAGDSIQGSSAALADRIRALASASGGDAGMEDLAVQTEDIGTSAGDMISSAGEALGGISSLTDSFTGFLREPNQPSSTEATAGDLSYALGALTGVIMLLYLTSALTPYRLAKPFFGVSTFIAISLMFLIWVVSGAILSLGTVTADICIAPTDHVLNLLGDADNGTAALEYYMTCSADPDAAPAGFVRDLDEGAELAFDEIDVTFDGIMQDLLDLGDVQIDFHLGNIQGNITATEAEFDALLDADNGVLSCGVVGGLWERSLEVICGDFFSRGVVVFWVFLLLSGLLLTITLALGLAFACLHPSTARRITEDTAFVERKAVELVPVEDADGKTHLLTPDEAEAFKEEQAAAAAAPIPGATAPPGAGATVVPQSAV